MRAQQRTLKTVGELLEVAIAAYRHPNNIWVYIPTEISKAANEAVKEGVQKTPSLETKGAPNSLGSLLSSITRPGEEKMQFDVDQKPTMVLSLSVDFSAETDYCGWY